MAITQGKQKALLEEIALLIVNNKNKMIVAMNKSNINTVSTATTNAILANQVIENLSKNTAFRKNLAALITDVNLSAMLEKKNLNSTGQDAVNVGANFGKTIEIAVGDFSQSIGSAKNTKDAIKAELKADIIKAEEAKAQAEKKDYLEKRAKRWSGIGVTLLLLGSIAVIGIGVHALKKYKSE